MAKAPWGIFIPTIMFAGMLPWKLLMVMATAEWEFNKGGGCNGFSHTLQCKHHNSTTQRLSSKSLCVFVFMHVCGGSLGVFVRCVNHVTESCVRVCVCVWTDLIIQSWTLCWWEDVRRSDWWSCEWFSKMKGWRVFARHTRKNMHTHGGERTHTRTMADMVQTCDQLQLAVLIILP